MNHQRINNSILQQKVRFLLITLFVTLQVLPGIDCFGQFQSVASKSATAITTSQPDVFTTSESSTKFDVTVEESTTLIRNQSAYTIEVLYRVDETPVEIAQEDEMEIPLENPDSTALITWISAGEDHKEKIQLHKKEISLNEAKILEIKDYSITEIVLGDEEQSTWMGYHENGNGSHQPIWFIFYNNGTCAVYDHEQTYMTGTFSDFEIDPTRVSRTFIVSQELPFPGSSDREIFGTLFEIDGLIQMNFVEGGETINFKRVEAQNTNDDSSKNATSFMNQLIHFGENNQELSIFSALQSFNPTMFNTLNAVSGTYSGITQLLTISGDQQDNVINISRATNGDILVNNGEVTIQGGTPNVNNTTTIFLLGLAGNDQLALNEFNGALPKAVILGGADNDLIICGSGVDLLLGGSGNDTIRGGGNDDRLFGGSGNDVLLGDRGNDQVSGQTGSDLLIWNNGDGSDRMEGGDGNDFVQTNGANGAGDDFSIDPNGQRVRFQRNNLGLFTLDIGTTENLDVNGQGRASSRKTLTYLKSIG